MSADILQLMALDLTPICHPGEAMASALILSLVLATPEDPGNTFNLAVSTLRARSAILPGLDRDSIEAAMTLVFARHVWWRRGEDESTETLLGEMRLLGVPDRFLGDDRR